MTKKRETLTKRKELRQCAGLLVGINLFSDIASAERFILRKLKFRLNRAS